MLSIVAALLIASTVLLPPVEAVVMPADVAAASATSGVLRAVPSTDTDEVGVCEASAMVALDALNGLALLDRLAHSSAGELARFAAEAPDAVDRLLAEGVDATSVAQWWRALAAHERKRISTGLPELVGNLEGLPYSVRDTANRALLAATMDRLETEKASAGRTQAVTIGQRIEAYEAIHSALGPGDAAPGRSLVTLRLGEQPTAAIALGDLDRADFVSYLIPGMFFGVRTQLGEWTDTAARLYDEQRSWLRVLATADESAVERRVATVAWIGYQAPDLLNVGSLDLARQGRDALASSVAGLNGARTGDAPYIALLAHSYGSTAALMALEETDTTVDALALVGSPGSAAGSVSDLKVRAGNVFVGEAEWDPIPNSAFFGSDPGAAQYGARIMSVAGGVDVITNEVLAASSGHNAYFDQGSESLRNLALIGIDRGELVTDGSSRDAGRTLALLAEPKA